MKTTKEFKFPGLGARDGRRPEEGSSFSGNERDRLFLNIGGGQFEDVSGISGLDHPGDGRSMALLDADRDGRLDAVVVSANAPWVQFYRNEIPATGNFLALRFEGANTTASARPGAGNRDGYGAMVEIELAGGTRIVREHRGGEGFAAQNSPTMLVGIGAHAAAERIHVRWPSGKRQILDAVAAGTVATVYEDEAVSPQGKAVVAVPYRGPRTDALAGAAPAPVRDRLLERLSASGGKEDLRVFAAFAVWCTACVKHAPEFTALTDAFGESIDVIGLPMDPQDEGVRLQQWRNEHSIPYRVLENFTAEERAAVEALAERKLRRRGLPYTFVTNRDGAVLWSGFGVPTVSDLAAHMPATPVDSSASAAPQARAQ